MVFYRKYRPQKISELDSLEIRDSLNTILQGKSVPHAFLFTGPKGLGKTSAARIIAKSLNCEKINDYSTKSKKAKVKKQKAKIIEPCNKCDQCLSIINGSNIDIFEIDGASNRGIDEIRDLREKIKLSPARALRKIYIIDEVHMLTTEAFNALLKTLEEPPAHAVFILCTTEQHKVPGTIKSRCSRIAFKKATKEELKRTFKRIVKEEKVLADDEVLLSIAKLSDGSFRDGVKVLEELISFSSGKKLTKELLDSKYQVLSIEKKVSDLLKALEEKNSKQGLEIISKLEKEGIAIKYFLEQLINSLNDELLIKMGVLKQEPQTTFSINELIKLTEILVKANLEIKYSPILELPLEIAVIQWSETEDIKNEIEEDTGENKKTKDIDKKAKPVLVDDDFWKNLIEKVNTSNRSAAGLLRGCTLVKLNNKVIEIETAYKFHKEKLDQAKVINLIEETAEELTGKKIMLSIILNEKRG